MHCIEKKEDSSNDTVLTTEGDSTKVDKDLTSDEEGDSTKVDKDLTSDDQMVDDKTPLLEK